MQRDALPTYRFTANVTPHHSASVGVPMVYVIEDRGLSVSRGGNVRVIPWTAFRFLHLHFTSGVGTFGFPVYRARLRTRWLTSEISSLDWQGEFGVDRSADYVRFMEELIPFAAARNPRLHLRHGGDPMMETAAPMILTLLILPLLFIPLFVFKPLGALFGGLKKGFGKAIFAAISAMLGLAFNALPWSSGKPFAVDDLPVAELPPRYRQDGI